MKKWEEKANYMAEQFSFFFVNVNSETAFCAFLPVIINSYVVAHFKHIF